MYESEANNLMEASTQIPPEVLDRFREFRRVVTARSLLPWGEHCTECVWPTCYQSCDLYRPREDGRCRRFVDGMVRIDLPGSVNSYLLKIRFKRWGKLWAPGNLHLRPLEQADVFERRDQKIGSILFNLPAPPKARNFVKAKRYVWKKRLASRRGSETEKPDLFVIECYNPTSRGINLSLMIRSSQGHNTIPYQHLVQVGPGFHRSCIPVSDICKTLDLAVPFSIDVIPNEIQDDTVLFFGLVDFVKAQGIPVRGSDALPVKCVVWDLDNTLWDGVLVEDGLERISIKPEIARVIQELDSRGILQSIASKNNFDDAMAALQRHGLQDYFLHPQISWGPKSEAVKAIARKLNIGLDTLLFVDDSTFERAEVKEGAATVTVFDALDYLKIPDLPGCQVPITEESRARRRMYREEIVRTEEAQSFGGDYTAFLRNCRIELEIEPLAASNLERVHELTQRTNQMNFSGTRYERKTLEAIARTGHLDTYVISCRDRFGSYGIVGFSIVDTRGPRMTDLMFSCRIQAKRVEHAFLTYLLKKYRRAADGDFWANWRKTPRNAPSGQVFADMGLEEKETHEGVTSLVFSRGMDIPDDGIVQIREICPQGEAALVRA